jgi:hypothetical protein
LDEHLSNHLLVVVKEEPNRVAFRLLKLVKHNKLGARKTIAKRLNDYEVDSILN